MDRKKMITITLAAVMVLALGTITTFASDTAAVAAAAAGQVFGLYPLAQSLVECTTKGSSQNSEVQTAISTEAIQTLSKESNEITVSSAS